MSSPCGPHSPDARTWMPVFSHGPLPTLPLQDLLDCTPTAQNDKGEGGLEGRSPASKARSKSPAARSNQEPPGTISVASEGTE